METAEKAKENFTFQVNICTRMTQIIGEKKEFYMVDNRALGVTFHIDGFLTRRVSILRLRLKILFSNAR